MKKIVAIMLAVCILFSGVCIFAENTEGYEKALFLVKERIGSTDGFDEFEGFATTDENGTYYSFSWSDDDGGYTGVAVTEGGVITEYYREDLEKTDAAISKRLSRDAAKLRAAELFAVINPDCEIKILECYPENNGFSVEFCRLEDGIPVENEGHMLIDAGGEKLTSMYYRYDPMAKFESGEIISYDAAVSAFNEKLGIELKYVSYYKATETLIKPVFAPLNEYNTYISALSGDVITVDGEGANDKCFLASGSVAEESAMADFSVAEQAELADIEMAIPEADALESIKRNKVFKLPRAAFEDISVSTYGIDDETRGYFFRFNWDEKYSARVRMNGQTGEVLSYSKYGGEEGKPVFSHDDAAKTAKEAFSLLAGERASEYRPVKSFKAAVPYKAEEQTFANFSFVRLVNGIPFYDNYADLTVSLADNLITGYNISYSDEEFPSLEGVIDHEKAADSYIKNAGYEPKYVRDFEKYRLVYALGDYYNEIDAVTGEYSGKKEQLSYADISGHYCEDIVNTLLEYGIGFDGDNLKPDEPIFQKEFAALLLRCVCYGGRLIVSEDYNYDNLYKNQLDEIIADKNERNPDGRVTRLDAAKYMSCAMGYGKIGTLDIYRPMFNDTGEAGFASILCGLKIMNGDGCGNFNPDGILTRAQALIMIYNYLNI